MWRLLGTLMSLTTVSMAYAKEPGSPQIALEGSPVNELPPWIISNIGCWNNMTGTPVEDCGSRSSLLTGSVRARRSWIFFNMPVLPSGGISASELASGVAAGNLAISVTCDGGSTNQATSVNAQINAAPANSVIDFPRGGCTFGANGGVINDAVAGHVIHGNGATITKLSAGDAFTISGAGVVVDHLNENGQSYANGGFTLTSSATGSGLIYSCASKNGGNGFSLVKNVDGFVKYSTSTNNILIGIANYQGNKNKIIGNAVAHNGAEGITFDSNPVAPFTGTVDAIIADNILTANGQDGCFGGIGGGDNSNNNDIFHNIIIGTAKCPGIGVNGQRNRIIGNRTYSNGAPGGLGLTTGIYFQHMTSASNANNEVADNIEDETYGINIDSTVEGSVFLGPNANPSGSINDPGNHIVYTRTNPARLKEQIKKLEAELAAAKPKDAPAK